MEPLNFEIIDAMKFFGALVSTPDVSESVKKKANEYMEKLINSLGKGVDGIITANSNIKVIR